VTRHPVDLRPLANPDCYGCLGTGRTWWAGVAPIPCDCVTCSRCHEVGVIADVDEGEPVCALCLAAHGDEPRECARCHSDGMLCLTRVGLVAVFLCRDCCAEDRSRDEYEAHVELRIDEQREERR
jgi:hypothetical protein